jgi:hypothetical protein
LEDHVEAAGVVQECCRSAPASPTELPRVAGVLARCASLVERDGSLHSEKAAELAKAYGDGAMDLLRQAVAEGFKDAAYLRKCTDFSALRSRADYIKMVAQLEARSEAK